MSESNQVTVLCVISSKSNQKSESYSRCTDRRTDGRRVIQYPPSATLLRRGTKSQLFSGGAPHFLGVPLSKKIWSYMMREQKPESFILTLVKNVLKIRCPNPAYRHSSLLHEKFGCLSFEPNGPSSNLTRLQMCFY